MSDTVRFGIIGTGMMGQEHIRMLKLLPGAEVTAFADPDSGSRFWTRHVVEESVEEYTDPAEMLRKAPVDAVVIASPNHTHEEVLEPVFATGKPVLCEKPLCIDVEASRRVVERSANHPGLFWVGMEYRYMPPLQRMLKEVRSGTIGRLQMLALREHRFPFLPKVGNWNRFSRNTGGTLVEKCCHFFDLMRHIIADEPVRVYASGAQDVNHLDEEYDGETPDILDNAYVIVDFAGGARALLDLCMFAEGSRYQEEISATGDEGKVECFVPDSTVIIGRRNPRSVEEVQVPVDEAVMKAGGHHGATYFELEAFVAALRSGGAPDVSASDGLLAVAMGAAAERSARERRPIEMTEVL